MVGLYSHNFNQNPRREILLPWVVGSFVIDDLFHYSYNISHGEVPFLVYNILDVAWLPWSPGRKHKINNSQGYHSSEKGGEGGSVHVQDKYTYILLSSKLLFKLICSMDKGLSYSLMTTLLTISKQKTKKQ